METKNEDKTLVASVRVDTIYVAALARYFKERTGRMYFTRASVLNMAITCYALSLEKTGQVKIPSLTEATQIMQALGIRKRASRQETLRDIIDADPELFKLSL